MRQNKVKEIVSKYIQATPNNIDILPNVDRKKWKKVTH